MTSYRSAFLPLLLLGMLLTAAACGGDDDSAETVSEPLPTVEAASAQLEPGVSRLAEGTFSTALVPSAVSSFDPASLPLEGGAQPPPCAEFVFAFAWQAGPGASGEGLVWRLTEMGVTSEIGSGAAGSLTIGCGLVEMVNTGGERIEVAVHYLIGRRP